MPISSFIYLFRKFSPIESTSRSLVLQHLDFYFISTVTTKYHIKNKHSHICISLERSQNLNLLPIKKLTTSIKH